MQLSGNYPVDDLVRTLQGNFSCQSVTKNAKGKPLDKDKQHIRLELFFVRIEIYSGKVVFYRNDDGKLTEICSLPVATE